VLVVEDVPADAELVLRQLQQSGIDFAATVVDSEADYLVELEREPDLVLADYSLPNFSATRALEILRNRGLDTPFIIVSGMIGEEVAVAAMQSGADDYLLKDRLARLGPAVTRALEQRQLRSAKRRAEERAVADLLRVHDAAQQIHRQRGPEVFQVIADCARQVMESDFSTLGLIRNGNLDYVAYAYSTPRALFTRRFQGVLHVISELAQEGGAVRLDDIREHPLGATLTTTEPPVGAVLVVPLIEEEELLGLLAVARQHGWRAFDEEDQALLTALAGHALIAVQFRPSRRTTLGIRVAGRPRGRGARSRTTRTNPGAHPIDH
jgi:CheY-like chemotaxis protein